jgi:D-xylose reductase
VKSGCRLSDGAHDYQDEKEAGECIKRATSEGLEDHEDSFNTMKLWNDYHAYSVNCLHISVCL